MLVHIFFIFFIWDYHCADYNSNAFLYQGFNNEWQRELVGFDTPHRLGSYRSNINRDVSSTSTLLNGVLNVTFTPGVDGDYAFPTVFYSGLSSRNTTKVSFDSTHRVDLSFQDNATLTSNPFAHTQITSGLMIAMDQFGYGNFDNWEYVYAGLSMEIKCRPDQQPPGKVCNSNAVWPTNLTVDIGTVEVNNPQDLLYVPVSFVLDRAWTPTHGGGKPFNYVLDYNVSIFLLGIAGNQQSFISTPGTPITAKGSNHDEILTGTASLVGPSSKTFTSAIAGIKGFSFQMHETDGFDILGRYMEQLKFSFTTSAFEAQSQSLNVQWEMGYKSPKTVLPADLTYRLSPTLLAFDNTISIEQGYASNGTVCISGTAFSCAGHHLKETTNAQVPVQVKFSGQRTKKYE